MNVFDKDLGVHQGRIPAATGGFVYELGHALLADVNVAPGDMHEVSQTFVMQAGMRVLSAHVRIVTPQELPVGLVWSFTIWLNDWCVVSRLLYPAKRVIVLDDMRVSLRPAFAAPAPNTIRFCLELETT